MHIKIHLAAALLMAATTSATMAQDAAALHTRALAATCANCHGTDGRTVDSSAIPALLGMPKSYMIIQMKAFKDGSRPATVMHQLAKGYTDQQIDSIASYFAATKR